MHFIVSVGPDKADPELRKLIRSHVMQGKNKGRILQPRPKVPKRVQAKAMPSTSDDESSMTDNVSQTSRRDEVLISNGYCIPRKWASDSATLKFADVVNPRLIDVILQFSSIAKQVLFPIESCIFFDKRVEQWIAPLATDPAYLHALIFTTNRYFDVLQQKDCFSAERKTIVNHVKALKLLRERFDLDDEKAKLSFTTIAAIMALAVHSVIGRDFESARRHVEGLVKIIDLRGGFVSFEGAPKILVEVLRCDIMLSICSQTEPLFFADPSLQPLMQYPDLNPHLDLWGLSPAPCQHQLHTMDAELIACCKVMGEFSTIINLASYHKQLITVETFLDTMGSVLYRLLKAHFHESSGDEVIRVALLAYTCSVMLPWKSIGLSHPKLDTTFKRSLLRIAYLDLSPQLSLWIVMVGAVSVFEVRDHEWLLDLLKEQIKACGIQSWEEMQEIMGSFMWIGIVHDVPGRRAYEFSTK